MQDAIQSQKKIEESLYNFGCDHTGGKNAWLQPKIIYLKRKGLFLRTKPSHLGEARGGRRASATWLECPVFTGHTRNVKPPYSAYVCVCVCEKVVVSCLTGCCLRSCFDLEMMRKSDLVLVWNAQIQTQCWVQPFILAAGWTEAHQEISVGGTIPFL